MNDETKPSKLSYKEEVLPWFCGLFLGRTQQSDVRVSDVCQELILALENRLITVYHSPFLKRNEVLVKYTKRGKSIIDGNTSTRFTLPPEIGCDDESLDKYFAAAKPISSDDLLKMSAKSSVLDDFIEQFSILERY